MIIVTGTLAYDYIMDFPGHFDDHILPSQIHKLNISFNLENFAKRRGGTAGNVSYSLGLLKTPHILFSVAGRGFSEYKKAFNKLGIDTKHVTLDKTKKISTGFAITDTNNNQIWGYYYGAAAEIGHLDIRTVATEKDLVLIGPSGAEGTMALLRQCVANHIPYIFDPGMILSNISNEDLDFGIKNAADLIVNDYEMTLIKERLPHWKMYLSGKTIITTLGGKGAQIEHEGSTYTIAAVAPEKIVDPTGAGDAWRAGFLAGLEKGFDMQTVGQMGAVAASFALEKYGTQEHKYTVESFMKRYQEAYKQDLLL